MRCASRLGHVKMRLRTYSNNLHVILLLRRPARVMSHPRQGFNQSDCSRVENLAKANNSFHKHGHFEGLNITRIDGIYQF
jgi:hypothetical protein